MGLRIPVPDDRPKQSPRGPKVRGGQPHVVARLGSQKRLGNAVRVITGLRDGEHAMELVFAAESQPQAPKRGPF